MTNNRTLKTLSVFGTRPDAVKMAPLVKALDRCSDIESVVCVTAQHREMLDSVLDAFSIKPDIDLNVMEREQSLYTITSKVLLGMRDVLERVKPELVLVHGDTTTGFTTALAAFYQKIPVCHIEAGLRTYDKYSPFPEEINRGVIGLLAELHMCPTAKNAANLAGTAGGVYVTGNTVIDAVKEISRSDYEFITPELRTLDFTTKRVVLATAHRRENIGQALESIFGAFVDITREFPDVVIVLPVHPNPAVRDTARRILGDMSSVLLTEPLPVSDMHNLMSRSYMVLTDSGGLQEEAPALGKPVLVLRRETERPEAVEAGTVKLSGVDRADIFADAARLLSDPKAYRAMANATNPYGDGRASERIIQAIRYHFRLSNVAPEPFC